VSASVFGPISTPHGWYYSTNNSSFSPSSVKQHSLLNSYLDYVDFYSFVPLFDSQSWFFFQCFWFFFFLWPQPRTKQQLLQTFSNMNNFFSPWIINKKDVNIYSVLTTFLFFFFPLTPQWLFHQRNDDTTPLNFRIFILFFFAAYFTLPHLLF